MGLFFIPHAIPVNDANVIHELGKSSTFAPADSCTLYVMRVFSVSYTSAVGSLSCRAPLLSASWRECVPLFRMPEMAVAVGFAPWSTC
jgi:hypothetical protein